MSNERSDYFGSEPVFLDAALGSQTTEQTLSLLGGMGTAADADVDAARMRAHAAVEMARRNGCADAAAVEPLLAVVMLSLTDALKDGSLCAGEAAYARMREVFCEVMQRRSADSFSEQIPASLSEALFELERRGFAARPGGQAAQGAFAGGPSLLICEEEGGRMLVYTKKSFDEEAALGRHLALLACGAQPEPEASPEQQAARAARLAVKNRLTVISGGPGTGKTTAVVNILSQLLKDAPQAVVFLAAPTGKAASRMKEAVANSLAGVQDEAVRSRLQGLEARTLHRMLYTQGADGQVPSKRHPIDADIIVVDESSMIDIGLACDLFERIDSSRTRVILLGDRFQLAAVGPGSFFADASNREGPLANCIGHLTKSWRFDRSKALGALAEASRTGSIGQTLQCLSQHAADSPAQNNRLALHEDKPQQMLSESFKRWFEKQLEGPLALIEELRKGRPHEGAQQAAMKAARSLAQLFFSTGVLAATREGPMSARAVNDFAEELFCRRGIVYPAFRPVIVRRNDAMLEVYNGDTGVVMPSQAWFAGEAFDPARAEVYFPETQRSVRFGLIGHLEPAFAITIHQSQGSEYHHVAVLMPLDPASSLATRELFYTAVTRVRDLRTEDGMRYGTLDVFGQTEVVKAAVMRPTHREGGLIRRISEAMLELALKGEK